MLKYYNARGPLGVVRGLLSRVNTTFPGIAAIPIKMVDNLAMHSERHFDRRYNVNTVGKILPLTFKDNQEKGSRELIWYEPCSIKHLGAGIKAMQIVPSNWTFVDVGAGLGRVPFVAATHGFRRTIGIEIDQSLYELSLSNLSSFNSSERDTVSFVNADALEYKFPIDEDLVIFMFTPFHGRTFEVFVERLLDQKKTNSRRWMLMYYGNNASNLSVLRANLGGEMEVDLPMAYTRTVQYRMYFYSVPSSGQP